MQEEQSGLISCEEKELDLLEQRFVNLVAEIIVEKIFKNYVSEKSNCLPENIEGQAK